MSSLAIVRRLTDRTEATLPDAEPDSRSRLGPKPPVVIVEANVGFGQTGLFAARQSAWRIHFSSRWLSGKIAGSVGNGELEELPPVSVGLVVRNLRQRLCHLDARRHTIEQGYTHTQPSRGQVLLFPAGRSSIPDTCDIIERITLQKRNDFAFGIEARSEFALASDSPVACQLSIPICSNEARPTSVKLFRP